MLPGTAGQAEKLNTPTTFRITGDVETTEQVFDGTTGGTLKTFDPSNKKYNYSQVKHK